MLRESEERLCMRSFKNIILEIIEELDERDKIREKVLSLSREIVRCAGFAIRAMHRGELKDAEEKLKMAEELLKEAVTATARCEEYVYKGFMTTAFQEYVEARLLHAFITGREIPSPRELGVPSIPYLMALGDFVGELRRNALICMKDGKFEEAEKALELMEEVYMNMMLIDYPEMSSLGFRQKCDFARSLLERTRAELLLVSQEAKLAEMIEKLLKERDEKHEV